MVKYGSKYLSTQFAGMDYLYNGYDSGCHSVNDFKTYYLNGSPNLPYINGINISNKEVSVSGSGTARIPVQIAIVRGNRKTYAATGTGANAKTDGTDMDIAWSYSGKRPDRRLLCNE